MAEEMVEIKPEKVRKDNSNLWRMEGGGRGLDNDLRRVHGKIPSYEEVAGLANYYKAVNYGEVNPYAEVEFHIDMDKFANGLSESNRKVFMMALDHVSAKIMADDLDLPLRTVYNKLNRLSVLLKDYFKEE